MRNYPRVLPSTRAFTLLEMLVASVVLTLIIVVVVQLTNSAASAVIASGKHMDADSQARAVFDRLTMDFARMLKRRDLDFSTFKQPGLLQEGNDQFAFYSEADGYFSGIQPQGGQKAPVSLIAYQIAPNPESGNPTMRRMAKGLGWEPNFSHWKSITFLPIKLTDQWPTLNDSNNPDPDFNTIADQVFRMEINYLLKGTPTTPAKLSITPWDTDPGAAGNSVDGFADAAGILVTIAVLDTRSRKIVSDYSRLTGKDIFADAAEGRSVAESWNAELAKPDFASSAGLPKQAGSAVRVYERYFPLEQSR